MLELSGSLSLGPIASNRWVMHRAEAAAAMLSLEQRRIKSRIMSHVSDSFEVRVTSYSTRARQYSK